MIALGNAYGYEHTVTRGIISALDRDVQVSDTQAYDDLIQTDASINPGNSGGPLLNIDGEMIGVNVAVRAGAQGIGFAIPIDAAMNVAAELMSVERTQNKWHGLSTEADHNPEGPLHVTRVEPSSPADNCGLKRGDEILSIGELGVNRPLDVERALMDARNNETLAIEVRRGDEQLTLDLTLASRRRTRTPRRAETTASAEEIGIQAWDLLGMELVEEPRSSFKNRNSRYRGGMRVVDVRPDSPAAQQGILPDDILVGMHRWETISEEDVHYILNRSNVSKIGPVKFYVMRGENTLYGNIEVAKAESSTRRASLR